MKYYCTKLSTSQTKFIYFKIHFPCCNRLSCTSLNPNLIHLNIKCNNKYFSWNNIIKIQIRNDFITKMNLDIFHTLRKLIIFLMKVDLIIITNCTLAYFWHRRHVKRKQKDIFFFLQRVLCQNFGLYSVEMCFTLKMITLLNVARSKNIFYHWILCKSRENL